MEKRIEARICLCFVAYKVYKKLERIVYNRKMDISAGTVLKIAKTITTIRLRLSLNGTIITKTMLLTPGLRSLKPFFQLFVRLE